VVTQSASSEPFAQALRAGNLQFAGDWLVRSFTSEVFGLCQAIVRDRTTAEDLSQEIFANAFASLAGFRQEASARTWLLAIARNRCIDHLRSLQRSADFDRDSDPEEFAEETALPLSILARRTEIEQALEDLTEMERGLIVLRFRNGLAYEELARAFGLKPGTVRMRVSRALNKMRGTLESTVPKAERSRRKEAPPSQAAMPAPAAPSAPARSSTRARVPASSPPSPRAPQRRAAPPAPPAMAASSESYSPASASRGAAKQRHALSDFFSATEFSENNAQPSSQLSATLSGMAAALSSAP